MTIRNVVGVDVEQRVPGELGDEVTLLFGFRVSDREIYVSSAEEDRGRTCFSLTANVSDIDLQIGDENES